MINYKKDDLGYQNLYYVINSWKKEIHEKTDLMAKDVIDMEDVVTKFDGRKS